MDITLNISWPWNIKQFIDFLKAAINLLDFFSIPGMGCAGFGYYSKLYFSVLTPVVLTCVIYYQYFQAAKVVDAKMAELELWPDADQDAVLDGRLKQQHKSERKDGPLQTQKRVDPEGEKLKKILEAAKTGEPVEEEPEDASTDYLDFDDHEHAHDPAELRMRYQFTQQKAALRQKAISRVVWLLFLLFPSITNKIFAFFMCFKTGDHGQQYMFEDFSQSCLQGWYTVHFYICLLLVFLIPIGIPYSLYYILRSHAEAIRRHEGPHEYEALYVDYKPDKYFWDMIQMVQKVTLIGMLTFIHQGSVLQALTGFVISGTVMCMFLAHKPYIATRSNIVFVLSQTMILFGYLAAVLLRVNLDGESFAQGGNGPYFIGAMLIFANLPMIIFIVVDSVQTIREELHAARIALLKYELGRIGSRYRCINEGGVAMSKHVFKQPGVDVNKLEIARIEFGDIVTVNAQAVVFQDGGAVARLHKQDDGTGEPTGWFSYNHHGMFGKRHFELADVNLVPGRVVAKLHVELRRDHRKLRMNLLRLDWSESFLLDTIGGSADVTERTQNVYAEVRVNREKKRTDCTSFMDDSVNSKGASWNSGIGQALIYDVSDPTDPDPDSAGVVEAIMVKVFLGDPEELGRAKANLQSLLDQKLASKASDGGKVDDGLLGDIAEAEDAVDKTQMVFLGECFLDLGDRIVQDAWEWDMVGLDATELREQARELTPEEVAKKAEMEAQGLIFTTEDTVSAAESKSLSERMHHEEQLAKFTNSGDPEAGDAVAADRKRRADQELAKQHKGWVDPLDLQQPGAAATAAPDKSTKKGKSASKNPKKPATKTQYPQHFRATTVVLLRAGPEIKTKKMGKIKAGEVVECTAESTLKDGTVRLRVGNRGWVSRHDRKGAVVMHKVAIKSKREYQETKKQKQKAEGPAPGAKGKPTKEEKKKPSKEEKKAKKKAAATKMTTTNPMFGGDSDSGGED